MITPSTQFAVVLSSPQHSLRHEVFLSTTTHLYHSRIIFQSILNMNAEEIKQLGRKKIQAIAKVRLVEFWPPSGGLRVVVRRN